jgi:hypothetical protein
LPCLFRCLWEAQHLDVTIVALKPFFAFARSVWKKLEEENSEFFQAYYIRLKLKKQINLFNHLLEHQYNLMKHPVPQQVPFAPTQNGIRPMPGNVYLHIVVS